MVKLRNTIGAVSLAFILGVAAATYAYESGDVVPDYLDEFADGGDDGDA